MNVSKTFLKQFAYLANRYGWAPAEIEEIKQATRENPSLMRYWRNLAIAHQAGYEQTDANGYVRLADWCRARGWPDPYAADLQPEGGL
jgi:hypothetical protein